MKNHPQRIYTTLIFLIHIIFTMFPVFTSSFTLHTLCPFTSMFPLKTTAKTRMVHFPLAVGTFQFSFRDSITYIPDLAF